MVTNRKLYRLSSNINIALLATLHSDEILLDDSNLADNFLGICCNKKTPIPKLIPISQGSTRPTIKSFEWGHTNTEVVIVVISKLVKGEVHIPTSTKV